MKIKNSKYLFIVIGVIFLMSCAKKQSWNCSCTAVASINPNGTAPVYTTTIDNATKSNATDLCNKYGGQKMPANSFGCTVAAQ